MIIQVLTSIYFTLFLVMFMMKYKDYKYYKPTYQLLNNKKFYLNNNQVYSHKFNEKDDNFVWFINSNDFKLNESCYLYNDILIMFFDPYSFYWLIKYQKWFKDNVNISQLPNY